jgi:hypothetical protein
MASPEKSNHVWIPRDADNDNIHQSLEEAAEKLFYHLLHRPGPQRNDPSLTAHVIENSVRLASESLNKRKSTTVRNWFTYLLTICTRQLLRQARKERKRIYVQSLDSLLGDRCAWEQQVESQLQIGQLLDLMDTSTRRIAELRLEQQGWPEIARLMGYKSGDAARKFFEAGLARLRKRLTGGPKETPEQD